MYYHIISSDLDGTLLSLNNCLTEYTKNVIQLLVSKGIYFVIATGRHYIETLKIKNNLGVSVFLITANGARIYDLNDQLIYSCNLKKNIVLQLIQLCLLEKDILIQLYSHDSWYISKNYFNSKKSYCSFGMQHKLFNLKSLMYLDVIKIFFTSSNVQKLLLLEKYIINTFKKWVNVSFSDSHCLEIVSCQVSKGNALKLLSDVLGLSLKDCLSFGDGMNDKDMLEMSGKGCIMKNGQSVLKKSLPNCEIIGSNSENGVANYLIKIFNL
ncbi:MAG: Cof-type HAD-IIB family hydrolase [Buchnera aphidicola (Schlechtendalia peitan)]